MMHLTLVEVHLTLVEGGGGEREVCLQCWGPEGIFPFGLEAYLGFLTAASDWRH